MKHNMCHSLESDQSGLVSNKLFLYEFLLKVNLFSLIKKYPTYIFSSTKQKQSAFFLQHFNWVESTKYIATESCPPSSSLTPHN